MRLSRHIIGLSILSILLTVLVFDRTGLDHAVQDLFFRPSEGVWLLDKDEPVMRLIAYDGLKAALALFGIGCSLALIASPWIGWARAHRKGLLAVVLSLALTPGIVGALKTATNVACPSKTQRYGGPLPDLSLLQAYPEGAHPAAPQRCFPAGHASGGFALFSLVYLVETASAKSRAALAALAIGGTMGAYKMEVGDHFLRHTLVTLELAVLIVALAGIAADRMTRRLGAHS